MSGLAPELRVVASGMIRGAMGLVATMKESRDTAIALRHQLDRQHRMAGHDDAGHHFAKAYQQAAAAPCAVWFASSLAMANGAETPTALTPDGDASEIARQLCEHLASIDE